MMTMRRLGSALATAGAMLATGAITTAAAETSSSTVRVRLNADIRSTNPGVNRDDTTDGVVLHMVEGLVAYGADGSVRPLLAESVDASSDGLTYSFKLRRGVTFHNGAPLTSADVLWSWQRYMDPQTQWLCTNEFNGNSTHGFKVEAVEAPDAETVVFRLNKPNAVFLASLARNQCGQTAIIAKDSLAADGSWKAPIGTGPFRFAEWRHGEFVRLTKFEFYASPDGQPDGYAGSKRPLVDELRYLIIPDSATAKAALLSGDVDILPDLAESDVRELEGHPEVEVTTSPTMMLNTILLQTRDPILSDVRIRQAIAAAIDTPALVASVTDGLGRANNSVVPTRSPYYSPAQAKGYVHDPALAKTLLAEAGYAGEPISMLANRNEPDTYDSAVIVQSMLQAVGLNVTLEVLDWATQLDRYNRGNYQITSFSYSARYDPALAYAAVIGSKDKLPNRIWDDAEAQALVDRASLVSDKEERQELFDLLHTRFLAEAPFIMLFNGVESAAASRRVVGFKASVLPKPRLWEVSVER